ATKKPKRLSLRGPITKLEWSNDGRDIYMSSKFNDSTYYLYRLSGLGFIADSSGTDYNGLFSSDIDSLSALRKGNPIRLTPIAKFKYPVTSISVLGKDTAVLVTTGGYKNKTGTVYYSTGNIRKALADSSYNLTYFVKKNGAGGTALPLIPAYSSLFEINDNKR